MKFNTKGCKCPNYLRRFVPDFHPTQGTGGLGAFKFSHINLSHRRYWHSPEQQSPWLANPACSVSTGWL